MSSANVADFRGIKGAFLYGRLKVETIISPILENMLSSPSVLLFFPRVNCPPFPIDRMR